MKFLISIALSCFILMPVFAQINAEEPTTVLSKDAAAEEDAPKVYYMDKGRMALHLNNYLVSKSGIVSMPVQLHYDITAAKSFTIGPMMTYYQMKNTSPYNEQSNQVNDNGVKYHQMLAAVKGSYHLMPLIQQLTNKPMLVDYVDVYVSAWGGYSFMFASGKNANVKFMEDNETLRGGVAAGVRSMVLPRFGFFIEMGYSSVGYGSFGITTVLK